MSRRHACFGGDPVAADPDEFGPWLDALALIADPDELAFRVSQLPGPGRSPDRADAMVWAMTELMLQPQRAMPRVRRL